MTTAEFLCELENSKCKYVLIDDSAINPIELIVLVSNKRVFKAILKENRIIDNANGFYRLVRIFSYSELGINSWKKCIYEKYKDLEYKDFLLSSEVSLFWIYYGILRSRRPNWLYRNVVTEIGGRHQIKSEEELMKWAFDELCSLNLTNGYVLNSEYIGTCENSTVRQWNNMLIAFGYRIRRRILYSISGKGAMIYHRISKKKYLKKIAKEGVLRNQWREISVRGSSGCVYIKIFDENGATFFKGNPYSKYAGFFNEIFAQDVIMKHECRDSCFLTVKGFDEKNKWISYPYIESSSLADIVKKRKLSKEEKQLVGKYLISVLDELNGLNIVHNDLRADNILVGMGEKGEITHFYLTDFGCASENLKTPWKTRPGYGNLYCQEYCGDYRYGLQIVDDATSAYYLYQQIGGEDEECLNQIRERIGRSFSFF